MLAFSLNQQRELQRKRKNLSIDLLERRFGARRVVIIQVLADGHTPFRNWRRLSERIKIKRNLSLEHCGKGVRVSLERTSKPLRKLFGMARIIVWLHMITSERGNIRCFFSYTSAR